MSFWRAEVRWAVVVLSKGMGLPSAVDEARDVEDVFAWKRGGKGKETGNELLLHLDVEVEEGGCEICGGVGRG